MQARNLYLKEIAEWHREQACALEKAALFESPEHEEPTRSSLQRRAKMHIGFAERIEAQYEQ